MSVKIQINSKDALERLIGEDDTMEIEVRNSAMAAFAQGAVKSVVNADKIRDEIIALKEQALKEVERVALDEIGMSKYRNSYSINDAQRRKIKSAVKTEFYAIVHECVERFFEKNDVEKIINHYVDTRVTLMTRNAVKDYYGSKILEIVAQAVKENETND